MTQSFDYVIVGSGINSLVCASLIAKSGKKVAVLERNDRIGGCIRSEALTLPGFRHDVLSSWHPLFLLSPAYAELKDDLAARGLNYCHTTKPTASLLSDDRGFVLTTDRQKNIQTMNSLNPGDGDRYACAMAFMEQHAAISFATLGNELWRLGYFWQLLKQIFARGPSQFAGDIQQYAQSARHWLAQDICGNESATCLAPWVLHSGLSPDSPFSAHMLKIIAFSLEAVGTPVVEGGSDRLLHAFEQLLLDHGAQIFLNTDADEILVEGRRAVGIRAKNQTEFRTNRAVICSVTPNQLYNHLLRRTNLPSAVTNAAKQFRHGLADMQIHLALDEAPRWRNPAMNDVAMVHVQDSTDAIVRAIDDARAGLLPASATIVAGQPCALDPSRAPNGKSILWIQLQELPSAIRGDALNEIEIPKDGLWNEEVRERYADRIINRLAGHIENLSDNILARKVLSPADLNAINVNLVGGDPYGGDCAMDQFLFWRPLAASKNHSTPIKSLYHIGASTHPGPGLGGGSGYLVGKKLCG